jgi:hypothetical protein
MYISGGSMYDSKGWALLVRVWELTVYNAVIDLDRWGPVLLPACLLAWAAWKLWARCLAPRYARRKAKTRTQLRGAADVRDLDV